MKIKSKQSQHQHRSVGTLQREVLDKLVYFQIFRYPLRAVEIQNVTHIYYSLDRIESGLQDLVKWQICFEKDGYYSISKDVQEEVALRSRQENAAKHFFSKLPFYVSLISKFPFVKGVAISGSLSKGVIHEEGDLDYFIITKKDRLWMARVALVFFKKVFLFNSRKYFCVNYFVGEDNLAIPDENIFTATEIEYLIPVFNPGMFAEFNKANSWIKKYYGHFEHPIQLDSKPNSWNYFKQFVEWCFSNKMGDFIEGVCMNITLRRWKVKFAHFNDEKFDLALRSKRDVSKHHPRDFQNKVLSELDRNQELIKHRIDALGEGTYNT